MLAGSFGNKKIKILYYVTIEEELDREGTRADNVSGDEDDAEDDEEEDDEEVEEVEEVEDDDDAVFGVFGHNWVGKLLTLYVLSLTNVSASFRLASMERIDGTN
jgi:hypothetical protein